jgi:hypothetical protein
VVAFSRADKTRWLLLLSRCTAMRCETDPSMNHHLMRLLQQRSETPCKRDLPACRRALRSQSAALTSTSDTEPSRGAPCWGPERSEVATDGL